MTDSDHPLAPALELPAPKKFSKTLIAPSMRPAPPTPRLPAATMASPPTPVTGFFANLFNWRPQMFVLRSFEGIATTRRECEKLLTQYTVGVDKESEDVWKCCVQQAHGLFLSLRSFCSTRDLMSLSDRSEWCPRTEGSEVQSRILNSLRARHAHAYR